MHNLFISLYRTTIEMSSPVLLASLGGLITYYTGTINVAMEGLILAGAFAAVLFSYLYASALAGVVGAIVFAVLLSLLYSFFVTTLKTNNFVMGFALNIFVSSLTLYLTRVLFTGRNVFTSPDIHAVKKLSVALPFPIINALFMNFSVLVYLGIGCVFVLTYVIFKTPFGLRLRAVGYREEAVTTAGLHTTPLQYIASMLTGVFCGLAGAQLAISNVVLFSKDMSGGRGFVALAVILVARGRPYIILPLALLFGLFNALSLQLQSFRIPPQFLFMLPYIITIATLVIISVRRRRQTGD